MDKEPRWKSIVGHPLWMVPMILFICLGFIEILHTKEHNNMDGDSHAYCRQKKWVKKLQMYYDNNAY